MDHINLTELPAASVAEIAAGAGHTLIERVFPPAALVEGLHDLTDVNLKAQELFGEQADTCTASSFLPALDTWYGFCHGWIPDPANYNSALWAEVGYPNGPETWRDLLEGGKAIKDELGVPLGIGLSPELDSRMAARAIIWSFGGSLQDENENVVIDSPEVVEAVEFMTQLYNDTMTEEVFAWTPGSNNQGLIAGELSYILNSISAYRTLQEVDPVAADDVFFGPALKGPRGDQLASSHVWQIYIVPDYVEEAELEAAKAFMLHLTANYNQAVFNSKLYNFPAFPSTTPQLYETYESTHFGEQPSWLDADPYGSRPDNKLNVLRTAPDWTVHIGWPGVANPAISQVFGESLLPTMMGKAALGELSAAEAVCEAHAQIEDIFEKWRAEGLVGGEASPDCAVG